MVDSPNATDLASGKSCVLRKRGLEMWMHQHRIMDERRDRQDTHRTGDWRLLADRASKEMDAEKLISLVLDLNRTLDEQQKNYFISD